MTDDIQCRPRPNWEQFSLGLNCCSSLSDPTLQGKYSIHYFVGYGNYPKILCTNFSDKTAYYLNSADLDQTSPEGAVYGSTLFATAWINFLNKCKKQQQNLGKTK